MYCSAPWSTRLQLAEVWYSGQCCGVTALSFFFFLCESLTFYAGGRNRLDRRHRGLRHRSRLPGVETQQRRRRTRRRGPSPQGGGFAAPDGARDHQRRSPWAPAVPRACHSGRTLQVRRGVKCMVSCEQVVTMGCMCKRAHLRHGLNELPGTCFLRLMCPCGLDATRPRSHIQCVTTGASIL